MKNIKFLIFLGFLVTPFASVQAFSGHWNYSWGDTVASSADIGTSVNRTCFLTGIGGNLYPGMPSNNNKGVGAGVRKKANGNYELYVEPHPNTHLIAYARCVNTSSGRVERSFRRSPLFSTTNSIAITPVTAQNQCFLQSVRNYSVATLIFPHGSPGDWDWGFKTGTQDSVLTQILTKKLSVFPYTVSTNWSISIAARPKTDIEASAVCFNANQFLSSWGYSVGDPGFYRAGLINVTSEPGATCGLTGIKGQFDAELGDWADAVYLSQDYVADYGLFFFLNVVNGKSAWASCIK